MGSFLIWRVVLDRHLTNLTISVGTLNLLEIFRSLAGRAISIEKDGCGMVLQFWYGRDLAQFGPFSGSRMRELALAGTILQTDEVWQDGSEQKCVASRVGNLFPAPSITPLTKSEPPLEGSVEEAVKRPTPRQYPVRAPERKKRVISIKGGILTGQDGFQAQYRKKCEKCGWEDSCRSSANIRVGMTRVSYFCRTCRKGRCVELTGISS